MEIDHAPCPLQTLRLSGMNTPAILIVAINARYSHCSHAGRTLLANLGDLSAHAHLLEVDLDTQPMQIAADLLARFGQDVLAETYLPGREFTVGLAGVGAAAEVLGLMEVEFTNPCAGAAIYSYETKADYETRVRYSVPRDATARSAAHGLGESQPRRSPPAARIVGASRIPAPHPGACTGADAALPAGDAAAGRAPASCPA